MPGTTEILPALRRIVSAFAPRDAWSCTSYASTRRAEATPIWCGGVCWSRGTDRRSGHGGQ
ncbi:hypothetical protein [Streptomyces sp. N50]|uniref:hypothetical protein n=1 Tax=Streptomyces sp. N50 TaxID=3081765 RepID=UPI0029623D2B|nr:hypothetical protein [Streptomyces sp. N50]WOX12561.1 hypothetical protein R2B38_28670 [Streptomyces sp. N50]